MAVLTWNNSGEHFYELGLDRGVVYVSGEDAAVWNGLTSVNEEPAGGDIKAFYLEGRKFLNLSANEEFKASIEAYAYPQALLRCMGKVAISPGLNIGNQKKIPFDFTYRTLVGNDVDGNDHGYKIHLVYNAMFGPMSRDNYSITDSPEPSNFSWEITCLPPVLSGYKPTAHFIVDSTVATSTQISDLEDIIYGTVAVNASMPTPAELVSIFA
jgi:hypothetical protein